MICRSLRRLGLEPEINSRDDLIINQKKVRRGIISVRLDTVVEPARTKSCLATTCLEASASRILKIDFVLLSNYPPYKRLIGFT